MAIRRNITRNCEEEFVTIFSAFQTFIEDKQAHNLAETSLHDYEDSFRYFMNHFEFDENTPLSVVNNDMFRQWTLDMIEKGAKPTSINRYLRECRVFFNWCINNALLFIPVLKIDMVKGQQEAIKAFPDEDIQLIVAKPTNKDDFIEWRTWTIINWILGTGNRARTVINVKIGDVDFKHREISLRHNKNKKYQVIPLSSKLATILKDYIHTWRYDCSAEDYLFPNIGNEQLTADALFHSFAKYCKRRGSSHTNIHGLRHSFALNWIRNGGSQFKLQKILGHSSLEMTRRYVALAVTDLKEDYDQFSTLDNLSKSRKPKKEIFNYGN